jgi:hypothetical protein
VTTASVPALSELTPSVSCDKCTTPVDWVDSALSHAFGKENVMLKHYLHPDKMYSNGESHSDLDLVVMDCVLSRSGQIDMKNRSSDKTGGEASLHPCEFNDLESDAFAIAARDGHAFNCCPSVKEDNDALS